MSPLVSEQRRQLLEVARRAVERATEEREYSEIATPAGPLAEPGAAFVTLHVRGRLRGCIGHLGRTDPLANVVAYCARAAAREDPRFSPIRAQELKDLEIEISILSPLRPASPDEIVIGEHGVMVRSGSLRGLLLPQVATEHKLTRESFLDEASRKAGLQPGAWREEGVQLEIFTAEVFSEADFRGETQRKAV